MSKHKKIYDYVNIETHCVKKKPIKIDWNLIGILIGIGIMVIASMSIK